MKMLVAEEEDAAVESRPIHQEVAAYRKEILAGGDGLVTGRAAGLIQSEIEADRRRLADRKEQRRRLEEKVPLLKEIAADAQQAFDEADRFGRRPVADCGTVPDLAADLVARIRQMTGQAIAISTLPELGQLIAIYPTALLELRSAARKAADEPAALQDAMRRALYSTASRELHSEADALITRLRGLETAVEERDTFLSRIDGKVARCEDRCDKLFRGERVDPLDPMIDDTQTVWATSRGGGLTGGHPSTAQLYAIERKKLASLKELQSRKSALEETNVQDREQVVKLQERLAGIREAMLDPANMRWTGEK